MQANVAPEEIEKFTKLADTWWEPNGPLYTLHAINPLRVQWINHQVDLSGKNLLDIGCGAGILTEALAPFAGTLTGIDQSQACIQAAQQHAEQHHHKITYLHTTAEVMANAHPQQFEVITCLECLEHVPDPKKILNACATLLKPGGDLFLSTLNRNLKAYLTAIVAAEYILKMIPKGTHQYQSFIKPSELVTWASEFAFKPIAIKGIGYQPLTKQFYLCDDVSVNYLLHLKYEPS